MAGAVGEAGCEGEAELKENTETDSEEGGKADDEAEDDLKAQSYSEAEP